MHTRNHEAWYNLEDYGIIFQDGEILANHEEGNMLTKQMTVNAAPNEKGKGM